MPAAHELVAFGPVGEDARKQLDRCLDAGGEEARAMLCADHHKGYSMPIGGVLASRSVVMPAGVGSGATPVFPGQLGFVGGSMGDDAVIIRGKESAASQRALYSTCMAQDA
jgi:RNA-splicing ligase RtcB